MILITTVINKYSIQNYFIMIYKTLLNCFIIIVIIMLNQMIRKAFMNYLTYTQNLLKCYYYYLLITSNYLNIQLTTLIFTTLLNNCNLILHNYY